jgi:hypothetical protein
MAREWVEFIQSQDLPWEQGFVRENIEIKTLSIDDETGASSLLLRYPPGWSTEGVHHLLVDEEFLVLDGDLKINDQIYAKMAYAHLPQGFTRNSFASRSGAVVLTFFSGRFQMQQGEGTCDAQRLVSHLDGFEVPYTGNFHPEFPPGAGRKSLYTDEQTGDQTWILGTMPLRWATRQEVHPVVEEMYLLSGEVHGNRGVMRPGAYFWRPPDIPHGPYGTLTGNLYLFRTKGGKLSTEYVDTNHEFHWWPKHDPALPERMKNVAREAPMGPKSW